VVPALTEALRDKDSRSVRTYAAALRKIKHPAAVLALTEALRDKDSNVSEEAAALGKINK